MINAPLGFTTPRGESAVLPLLPVASDGISIYVGTGCGGGPLL
jgi:hypothetical protein